MMDVNDLRKGTNYEYDDSLYTVIDYQHNKTGRGGAIIRIKSRNILSSAITERTFKSGEKVKDVRLESIPMQYLYSHNDLFVFMNQKNYEQIEISKKYLEDALPYLKENMALGIKFYKDKPIGVDLPITVDLLVENTEPGLKGDTVSGATKPVILETGLTIQAPLFIGKGDIIRIDTRTGAYLERV